MYKTNESESDMSPVFLRRMREHNDKGVILLVFAIFIGIGAACISLFRQ